MKIKRTCFYLLLLIYDNKQKVYKSKIACLFRKKAREKNVGGRSNKKGYRYRKP